MRETLIAQWPHLADKDDDTIIDHYMNQNELRLVPQFVPTDQMPHVAYTCEPMPTDDDGCIEVCPGCGDVVFWRNNMGFDESLNITAWVNDHMVHGYQVLEDTK